MKKILSLFLCVLLFVSLQFPVNADSISKDGISPETSTPYADYIVLKYDNHGEFSLISKQNNFQDSEKFISNYSNGEKESFIIAKKSNSEGIYISENDLYLVDIDDGRYLATTKINVDKNSFNKDDFSIDSYPVPMEILEDIENTINLQYQLENNDFEIDLYIPYFDSSKTDSTTATKSTSYPSPSYYSKYGVNFKDTFVKYTNLKVSKDVVGTSARNKASAFTSFLISLTGTAGPYSTAVSLFSTGQSALSLYQSMFGSVTIGNSNDEIFTSLLYDKLVRTTRRENTVSPGSYNIGGYTTCKIWLNKQTTYQYYSQRGNDNTSERYINQILGSNYYSNAAYMAMINYPNSLVDDPVVIKFLGGTASL